MTPTEPPKSTSGIAPRDPEAVRIGRWLEGLRTLRGWRPKELFEVAAKYGFQWKHSYYGKFASGERHIRQASEAAREALRLAYEIPAGEWFEMTGIKPMSSVINRYPEKSQGESNYSSHLDLATALRSLPDYGGIKYLTSELDNYAEISIPDSLAKFFTQIPRVEISRDRNPASLHFVYATNDLSVVVIGDPNLLTSAMVAYRSYAERVKGEAPHFIAGQDLKYVACVTNYFTGAV